MVKEYYLALFNKKPGMILESPVEIFTVRRKIKKTGPKNYKKETVSSATYPDGQYLLDWWRLLHHVSWIHLISGVGIIFQSGSRFNLWLLLIPNMEFLYKNTSKNYPSSPILREKMHGLVSFSML
jgi:hypothetical protein